MIKVIKIENDRIVFEGNIQAMHPNLISDCFMPIKKRRLGSTDIGSGVKCITALPIVYDKESNTSTLQFLVSMAYKELLEAKKNWPVEKKLRHWNRGNADKIYSNIMIDEEAVLTKTTQVVVETIICYLDKNTADELLVSESKLAASCC